MSEMPEYTEHEIRERNIRQFAANERERAACIQRENLNTIGAAMAGMLNEGARLRQENARLHRENQHLRDFICKILGRPFVEMADETKEVWR